MALTEAATMLENVRNAINTILNKGKIVVLNGRRYERQSIKELMDLEVYYKGLVQSESTGSTFLEVDPI